jgi:hypothetical protein
MINDMTRLLHDSELVNIEHSTQIISEESSQTVLWNYQAACLPEELSCQRLIKIAEQKRWNPDADINWQDESVHDQFPCIKHADPFVGFDEYEELSRQTKLQISWQRHSMEISDILHGEQLAMLCASQLILLLPGMEGRLFASRQVADEARHIEFFRTYLTSVTLPVSQPSAAIRELTMTALQNPHWEIKLLICQILIESLAMAQFSYLSRTSNVNSLKQGLQRIMEDEARHVKFGADYLASRFKHHNAEQLGVYGNFVVDHAFGLASSDNHCVAIAQRLRWDVHRLRHHLRQQRISNPEATQRRFRQLSINLKAAGLMNEDINKRLQPFSGV